VSLGLLACATKNALERSLENEGATRLTKDQVTTYLAGNTQQWQNGGAYFRSDGVVYVKWGGKIYPERTWTVYDNGKTCIVFPDGRRSSCSAYYDLKGTIWSVTLEVFGEELVDADPQVPEFDGSIQAGQGGVQGGPDKILKGNRLSDI
jgi:hypothetical protein